MKTSAILPSLTAAVFAAGLLLASASGSFARDRFEYDPTPKKPPGGDSGSRNGSSGGTSSHAESGGIHLAVGQVAVAFEAAGTSPELAFYIPATKPTIVQVVIETHTFRKPTYFVKGISPGRVTGAVVPRECLDKSGFAPKTIADEARIQAAIKARPITLVVK